MSEMKQLKARIRHVMEEHLRSKGFPDMTRDQIFGELKPMWIKLEEAQLTRPNWRYADFVKVAQSQAERVEMKKVMAESLYRRFTRGRR